MAQSMQFDLVSPERSLASLRVSAVQIPGAEGDLTAMPDHAPGITTLRPGILTVTGAEGESRYAVTGGFAEITPEGTTVLAERAVRAEDMTAEIMAELMAEARAVSESAEGVAVDTAAKLVADMKAMADALGVSA